MREGISPKLRFAILDKFNFRCVYCGVRAADSALEIDHIFPVFHGGDNEEENLTVACKPCNIGKGVSFPSIEFWGYEFRRIAAPYFCAAYKKRYRYSKDAFDLIFKAIKDHVPTYSIIDAFEEENEDEFLESLEVAIAHHECQRQKEKKAQEEAENVYSIFPFMRNK